MGTVLKKSIETTTPITSDTAAEQVTTTQPACTEGDWNSYLRAVAQPGPLVGPHAEADAMDYKRRCAIDYLGKRAMLHGGVCRRGAPRILTQQFSASLEKSNRAIRYARYPWLERLMKLFAEIEALQDQFASDNVISLVQKPVQR
ncbi:MAG: hypothetical protein REI95_06500 [Oxalicibacterium faecigallinarum]|uniref:hypothetical protein n=1 Tax=Oxalicibacterium faecigallinarum TaxID=573741 RepID=UPI002809F551|nr:hypothetical protein [Oxalicibacterium faecigallinarum]MDQ7969278.1 hypothetical protein [Oxalicibacterium faecigallinarum]